MKHRMRRENNADCWADKDL